MPVIWMLHNLHFDLALDLTQYLFSGDTKMIASMATSNEAASKRYMPPLLLLLLINILYTALGVQLDTRPYVSQQHFIHQHSMTVLLVGTFVRCTVGFLVRPDSVGRDPDIC